MSDHEKCIRNPGAEPSVFPPQVVAAETRAAAHQVRALAEHLLGLADLLPHPPDEEVDRLSGEEAFARYPAYELYADLQIAVADGLVSLADFLEESGRRPLGGGNG